MSSQSATARHASTSYTFGVPGSKVTLTIGKDGNRSLELSRGAAAAAHKPAPAVVAPPPANVRMADTRSQLHVLCDNIQMDKRSAMVASKRAAAAAVASESSKKRKQESAMVPA